MENALRIVAANDDIPAAEVEWAHVFLAAVVRTAFGDHEAKIREVSSKGAVIQGVAPPAGSQVLLMRGAIAVFGTVVWTKTGRYSLDFQDAIDPKELLVPIRTAKKGTKPLTALFPLLKAVPGTVAKH